MGAIVPVIINNIPAIIAAVGSLIGLFKSHKNGQVIAANHAEAMAAIKSQPQALKIS